MAEIFKNFTDNPWFWATVALIGLFNNYQKVIKKLNYIINFF